MNPKQCRIPKNEKGRLAPPLSIASLSVLERELQTKLNQPGIIGRGDTAEVDGTDTSIWVTEIRVIEDIEKLRSEFNDLVLADLRALHQGNVEVNIARSMEHVTTEITEASGTLCQRSSGTDSTEERIASRCASASTRSVKGMVRGWDRTTAEIRVRVSRIEKLDLTAEKVRSIATGAGERTIAWFGDVEGDSRLEHGHTTDLPASQNLAGKSSLVFEERQFVDVAQHVAMTNVLLAVSTIRARIVETCVGPQSGRVVNAVTPRVSVLEIKAIREALRDSHLKTVVV